MATTVTKVIDPDLGSGYDYDSLYDWEAACQGDLTGVRDEIAIAKCRCTGGTADTTTVSIGGWTVSATQYIKIWTDPAESYRHNGTWQTGNKYRFVSTAENTGISTDNQDYVRLDGLQVTITGTGAVGIYTGYNSSSAKHYMIENCIVKGCDFIGINCTHGGIVRNNLVYDCTERGFSAGNGDVYLYNNTAINCGYGFLTGDSDGVRIFKNCLASGCTDGFYAEWSFSAGCYNNASSIASDAPGTNSRDSQTFSFVGAADFHLAPNDTGAIGYGLNLYNDANYPFQTDIDGDDRGGSGSFWSIGAEGTFQERIFVIDPDMGTGYDYDSLYDWEAAQQKTCVCPEVAKCRCTAGTADTTIFAIDGWTTSATQYIKVWTDTSESYRHNGTWQTGNVYRLYTPPRVDNGGLFNIDELHVRIIGLAIGTNVEGWEYNYWSYGLSFGPAVASGAVWHIHNNFFYVVGDPTATFSNGIQLLTIAPGELGAAVTPLIYIINNILINNMTGTDVKANSSGISVVFRDQRTYIYNNTSINFGDGIYVEDNDDYRFMYLKNNLLYNNTVAIAGTPVASRCSYNSTDLADIGYDGGTGDRESQTFSFAGANDYHLAANDTGALGYGTNLYNDANYPFQDDIDGDDRGGSGHFWSVGADGGYEERTFVIDPDAGTGYDYDSLYDWEAAQQKTCVCPEVANCVSSSGSEDIVGVGGGDTVVISGWTTSATQYPEIRGGVEGPQWDNTLYRLVAYGGALLSIDNQTNYLRVIGVQFKLSHGDAWGVGSNNAAGLIFRNCIVWSDSTDVYSGAIVINTTAATITANSFIINCLAFGQGFGADSFAAAFYGRANSADRRVLIYNCTVNGGYTGIRTRDSYTKAVNCLLIGQTEKSFYESPTADYCGWSNDNTTSTNGTNAIDLSGYTAAQIFVDPDNGDFHLLSSSPAIGVALNLYNDAYYPFQSDIDGNDRGGSGTEWDIGADQYNPILLYYRTAATPTALSAASWTAYTVPFMSLGYIQLKAEA